MRLSDTSRSLTAVVFLFCCAIVGLVCWAPLFYSILKQDDVVPLVSSVQENQSIRMPAMSAGAATSAAVSSGRSTTDNDSRSMAGGRQDEGGTSTIIYVAGLQVEAVAGPGVSDKEFRLALDSVPFKQWVKYMEGPAGLLRIGDGSGGGRISLQHVLFQSVDLFGERVGFVKFKAEVVDKDTGSKLPGIVFGRGSAVGILMLLESDSRKYAVLTDQARVPVGRSILELPAGMLDDGEGDFVGTAAREVEEETGIHIRASELVDLTALLDESTGRKMFPSPGGCDEDITLFLYRGKVSKEVIEQLQGRETGLRDHGELIKVHVVPYERLWRSSADAKVLAAIAIYEMSMKEGILPPTPPVSPPSSPRRSHL
ncbi:hypothetical protein CBR_g30593 [Chara braunii]|uniref:Nudix hydrolase domain-containing protein n=1 Tax=Chara braunii TaxID=69332 RepID=A0A388LD54_CHABU|nr:hypothetical protein CBR_g30593 [Chara braunii]|eukprot:GBG80226.1 hypothetical protein CBR_g30593 [Chara braunii]